ncbi:MAG: S-layer homology domain-containing protein, partial [Anaerolineales bacterium]|nr:S-layer homology domain-containing protein [Anaerolineales bacterium]
MKSTNKRYQFTQNLMRIIIGGLLLLSFGNTSPVYAVDDPEFTIVQTDSGDFADGKTGSTITISITNNGSGATNGSQVTVINTLPSHLSATAINAGAEWACVLATLTCTSSAIIGVDQPYSDIILTVNVAVDAPELITNTVAISGGGDVTPGNNGSDHNIAVITKPDLIVTGYTLRNAANDAVITKPEPNTSFYVRMTIKNQGGGAIGNFYPGVFLDGLPNYGPDTDPFGRISNWSGYRQTPSGSVSGEGCMYYDPTNSINPLITEVDPERGNYTRFNYNAALDPGASATLDILIGYPDSEIIYSGSEYNPYRNGLADGIYKFYLYADPNCSGGDAESNEGNNSFGPLLIPVGDMRTFQDVPATAFGWSQIESIYAYGITGGCGTAPLIYCPDNSVTRAQMAVFLLRGIHGPSYAPPAATGIFADVPNNDIFAAWIERFAAEGITSGCGGGNYCPSNSVTRAQ